jgi:hypothetical protein
MSDSHEDREKQELENLLNDPGAIQELIDIGHDEETAREIWERFKNDLLPEMS